MAEVKWIKITTNMFDDEKIDFIQSLPEGDSILIIWIRLLTMAGKCNAGGYVFLTENIPYTDEALSYKFKKPANIIKLALGTFEKLGMIQKNEKGLYINNFSKYQNMEGLEKLKQREYEKIKKRKQREKLKQLPQNSDKKSTVPGTIPGQSLGTPSTVERERDIDIEIDKDIDIDKDIYINNIKRESRESTHSDEALKLCQYYSELKPGQDITAQFATLQIFIEQYGFDWCKEALQITVEKKSRFISSYMETILKNWVSEGKEDKHGAAEEHQVSTRDPDREGIGLTI